MVKFVRATHRLIFINLKVHLTMSNTDIAVEHKKKLLKNVIWSNTLRSNVAQQVIPVQVLLNSQVIQDGRLSERTSGHDEIDAGFGVHSSVNNVS